MGYISGLDRNQAAIVTLDQYVDEDNLCRVIDAFVNSLDFKELGFMYSVPKDTGRPPFDPGDMMKLYLYGNQYRIRSSRRLEAESMRNVEVMWLLNGLAPDDKTISNFRKDNRKAMKEVFKTFNRLCMALGLFGKDTVAVDGTKIKANNSRKHHYTQNDTEKMLGRLDKKVAEYLNELDRNDIEESGDPRPDREAVEAALEKIMGRKSELEAILEKIKENGGEPVCTVDEDAALMKQGGGKGFDVCYNVQTSVDDENGLVVDFNVTDHANDLGELSDMVERSKEVLGVDKINVLADTGYSKGEEIDASEEAGATCYIPKAKPSHQPKNEEFNRENFKYDAESNTYTCPTGNVMPQVRTRARDGFKVYANRAACKECPVKDQCTKSQTLREIERSPYQENVDRADRNAKENPDLYQRRMELSEHPFGVVKRIWGFGQFLCRGNEMVTGEIALAFMAFNLRRAVNILGVKKLVEAIHNAASLPENPFASLMRSIFSMFEPFFGFVRLARTKMAIIF
jgi:transposase